MAAEKKIDSKSQTVKSEIHLDVRPGDKPVSAGVLSQFGLFRRMKKAIPVEKLPGSIVRRSYKSGEVVFQQGQSGGTAFYIPTAEDLTRLNALEQGQTPPADPVVDPERNRHVLSALIIPSTVQPRTPGLFERWFSPASKRPAPKIAAIPVDGPTDIDYVTREAPLLEGDLFGEMSCISYTPRSATVIARVDCQLLEFNRNVFDQLRGDPNHQASVEAEYRRRTLNTSLRQFELFRDLSDSQIQTLKDNASFEVFLPGKVICEEGERWSDGHPLDVFIVRSGVVQVTVNAQLSLRADDIRDWTGLCRQLVESRPDPSGQGTQAALVGSSVAELRVRTPASQIPPDNAAGALPSSPIAPRSEIPPDVVSPAPKKPSTQDLMAAMRAKKAEPALVAQVEPTAAPVQASVSPPEAPAAKKPSTQEIMAAMRAKKAESAPAAQVEPTAAPVQASVSPPETPAAKKPSTQEIMAAMRAKKAESAPAAQVEPTAAPVQASASPPETPAAKKPSTQDIMAAMRAKKSGAATSDEIPQTIPAASQSSSVVSPIDSSSTPEARVEATADLPLLKESRSKGSGPPAYLVYSWLSDPVQQMVSRCVQGEPLADSMKAVILNALNALAGSRPFLQEAGLAESLQQAELVRKTASFPKGLKGIAKDWSELELRTTGRAVLSQVFPTIIRKPIESSGPPRVLAYMSRGDCIGEIAVVTGSPRTASCIAYNHPSSDDARDFGNVELVRIPGTAFRRLMAESPPLKQRVEKLAAERISNQAHAAEGRHTESDLVASTEFQQMGLFQGTRLLVIDLDSCTRCGDCVQACVDTHDDGYSRLFLDGPRYDRFLVPSSCRNCLNPVCMIGCPVGSIGRGNNGQIEIYDWCIGCSVCADQCPYDSIQMHDTGLISEESLGWLCASRRSLPDDWHHARRLSSGWKPGSSPFRWQGDTLREWSAVQQNASDDQPLRLCFRHEFRLPKKSNARSFRLSINDDRRKSAIEKVRVKKSKVAGVWLNGEPLEWIGNSLDLEAGRFARADNVLAIEVTVDMPAEYGQFILSASLDAIPEAGSQTLSVLGKEVRPDMDLVTRRAAVCDLCSHLPSQQPACVTSCPHDAAIRINPLVNFPH